MGDMLAKPETQKFSTMLETTHLRVGCCSMQGWRRTMEDAHVMQLNVDGSKTRAFFGVFDGHQSDEASRYCRAHMYDEVSKALAAHRSRHGSDGAMSDEALRAAFEDAFQAMDAQVCQRYLSSGTTANCVLLYDDRIVCANAGDSRAVLCRRGGVAVPLSVDHKPTQPQERGRVERAGGHVENGRVNMTLAVSRALGDVDFKQNDALTWREQIVTAQPDVTTVPLDADDEFVVLACDGVWDVLSSEACCSMVRDLLRGSDNTTTTARGGGGAGGDGNGVDVSLVCEHVLDHCLADTGTVREGTDNMTIILVQLKQPFAATLRRCA